MSNRLLVTTTNTTPHGQLLVETVEHLVQARQGMSRLQAAIGQMTYGVPADWEQMRAELGLATAQAARDLASLLTSAETALAAPILGEFVARCDQG